MSNQEKVDLKRDNRLMTIIIGVVISLSSMAIGGLVKLGFNELKTKLDVLDALPAQVQKINQKVDEHIAEDSVLHLQLSHMTYINEIK